MRWPRWGNSAVGVLLALTLATAFFAILQPPTINAPISNTSAAVAAPKPPATPPVRPAARGLSCPGGKLGPVVYYANQSGKTGFYNFGRNPDPKHTYSARHLVGMLKRSWCHDQRLAQVYYHELVDQQVGYNRPLTLAQWRHEVAAIDRRVVWSQTVFFTGSVPKGTRTWEMIPQTHAPPIVERVPVAQRYSRYLLLTVIRHGIRGELLVRIPCRFQPEDFPSATG